MAKFGIWEKGHKKQSWNFLNNLEVQEQFGWQVKHLNLVWNLEKVCFHIVIGFKVKWLDIAISYGCHDANMIRKSGKIIRIFQYKAGAVTHHPRACQPCSSLRTPSPFLFSFPSLTGGSHLSTPTPTCSSSPNHAREMAIDSRRFPSLIRAFKAEINAAEHYYKYPSLPSPFCTRKT